MPATMHRLVPLAALLPLLLSASFAAAQPAPETPAPPAAGQAVPPGTPDQPTTDADTPDMRRIAACKEHALTRLKARSPSVDDIFIDVDGLTVAEADGKLGDTAVKGVLMGEAYIRRDRSDRPNRFLCLTGDKDEVLFTFFTEQ